jgi:alkylation response protein AidB-like acyl-CoA dehydrogenase
MVLTEPDAGSDLQAVQLKAELDGATGIWHLTGVKRFITNGCGDVLLVLARSEPGTQDGRGLSLFVCTKGPTIQVRRVEEKLGIHGSPTCELQFNRTPAELIGQRRRGLIRYVMALMNGARLGIAAQALGIAEAAYRKALQYAKEREQFGKPIIHFPAVYDLLLSSKVELEAARELTYDTARLVDLARNLERRKEEGRVPADQLDRVKAEAAELSKYVATLTPMSKYWASEMCNRVAYNAISVFGGSGYMRDYDVERHYRDARITSIYEGTTQLQVVAAIGGILSGKFRPCLMAKAERRYEEPIESLAARLRGTIAKLDGAVEFVKNMKNEEYTDYVARRLVDLWMETYTGFLLIESCSRNVSRMTITRKYIADLMPRVEMNYAAVTSGDLTTVEKWREVLG